MYHSTAPQRNAGAWSGLRSLRLWPVLQSVRFSACASSFGMCCETLAKKGNLKRRGTWRLHFLGTFGQGFRRCNHPRSRLLFCVLAVVFGVILYPEYGAGAVAASGLLVALFWTGLA